MQDFERFVFGLKDLRDDARMVDAGSTMAQLIAMALQEVTILAWDAVMRDPDEKRQAARFFRLYDVVSNDE